MDMREHLATVVMGWHVEDMVLDISPCPSPAWADSDGRFVMACDSWYPDESPIQFFLVKNAMRGRGWFWHGWEDESGANVEYWKPGESHMAYGKDLMEANALAAAEAMGYESG